MYYDILITIGKGNILVPAHPQQFNPLSSYYRHGINILVAHASPLAYHVIIRNYGLLFQASIQFCVAMIKYVPIFSVEKGAVDFYHNPKRSKESKQLK